MFPEFCKQLTFSWTYCCNNQNVVSGLQAGSFSLSAVLKRSSRFRILWDESVHLQHLEFESTHSFDMCGRLQELYYPDIWGIRQSFVCFITLWCGEPHTSLSEPITKCMYLKWKSVLFSPQPNEWQLSHSF